MSTLCMCPECVGAREAEALLPGAIFSVRGPQGTTLAMTDDGLWYVDWPAVEIVARMSPTADGMLLHALLRALLAARPMLREHRPMPAAPVQ